MGVTPVEFRGDLWRQKTRVPGLSCGVFVILRLAVLVFSRAVSSTLQVSASAATAKEGGARPIVAGQLQTYIELIDSLQGARETCAGTPATSVSYTHLTLPTILRV